MCKNTKAAKQDIQNQNQ